MAVNMKESGIKVIDMELENSKARMANNMKVNGNTTRITVKANELIQVAPSIKEPLHAKNFKVMVSSTLKAVIDRKLYVITTITMDNQCTVKRVEIRYMPFTTRQTK